MCRDSSHFSMPPEIQPVRIDKTEKENILDALFSFDDVSQCNKQKDQLDSSIHFRHGNDDLLRGGKSVCSEEQITPFKRRKDRVGRTHYSIEGRSIKRIKYSGTFTDHERSIILRRVADIISFVQQQCHLHIQYFLSLREKEETKVKNASISVQKFNIYSDEALRVLMAKHSNKSYDPHVVKEITLIVSVYALCGRCRTFEEEKIMQSIVEKGDMSLALANVDTLIKILSPRVICINESIPTDMVRLVASLMEFNCSMKQQVVSTTSGYCYNCQQPLCGRENVDHACEICGAVELFDMPPITNAFQFDDLFGSGRCFFSNTTLFSRFSNSPQGQQRIKNRIYEAVRAVCKKVNILSEQEITFIVQNVVRYAQSGRTATIKKVIAACIFLYIRNEQEIISLPQIALPLNLHLSTLTSTVQRVARVLGLQDIASISYQNLISHSIQCLLNKEDKRFTETTTEEIRLVEQETLCATSQVPSFHATSIVDTLALFETSSSSVTVSCTLKETSANSILSSNDIASMFDKLINDDNRTSTPSVTDKSVLCVDQLLNESGMEKQCITTNEYSTPVSHDIKRNKRKSKKNILSDIVSTQKTLWIRTTETLYQSHCLWKQLVQKNMSNQEGELFQTKSTSIQLYFVASALYYSSVYLKINVLTRTVAKSLGINVGTFHRVRKTFIYDLEQLLRHYGLISDMTDFSSYNKNMFVIYTTLSNTFMLNFLSNK